MFFKLDQIPLDPCICRNWGKPAGLWAHSLTRASHRPGELWPGTRLELQHKTWWAVGNKLHPRAVRPLPWATGRRSLGPWNVLTAATLCAEDLGHQTVEKYNLWWRLWATWYQLYLPKGWRLPGSVGQSPVKSLDSKGSGARPCLAAHPVCCRRSTAEK